MCAGNAHNSLNDEPIDQLGLSGVGNPSMEEETWSCQICTFDNPLDSMTCDICDTPREEEHDNIAESAGMTLQLLEVKSFVRSSSWHYGLSSNIRCPNVIGVVFALSFCW